MESLAPEVAPFGIRTMLVEPGFFRTELLTPESTQYAESSIEDYAERTEQTVAAWKSMNGQQGGDPAKLAQALVQLCAQDEPPLRFPAGADAVTRSRTGPSCSGTGRRQPRPVIVPRLRRPDEHLARRSRLLPALPRQNGTYARLLAAGPTRSVVHSIGQRVHYDASRGC